MGTGKWQNAPLYQEGCCAPEADGRASAKCKPRREVPANVSGGIARLDSFLGAKVADKIRLQSLKGSDRRPPEAEMAVGKNRHPAIPSVNSAILRAAKPHRVLSHNTSVTEVSTGMG